MDLLTCSAAIVNLRPRDWSEGAAPRKNGVPSILTRLLRTVTCGAGREYERDVPIRSKAQAAIFRRPLAHTPLYAVLLFVLGFCVLSWGTAYKTSLYKAPETGRAPAKLCTRASDDSRAEVERAVDGLGASLGLLLLTAAAFATEPRLASFLLARPRREAWLPWRLPFRMLPLQHRPPPAGRAIPA